MRYKHSSDLKICRVIEVFVPNYVSFIVTCVYFIYLVCCSIWKF